MNKCRVCGSEKNSKTTSNLCRNCEALKKREIRVRERVSDDLHWLRILHKKQGYHWEAVDISDDGKAIDYLLMPNDGDSRDSETLAARADGLLWASINGCNYILKRKTVKQWELEISV